MFKKKPEPSIIDLRSYRQQMEEYTVSAVRTARARAESLSNSIRDAEAELRDTLDVVKAYEAALESFNEPELDKLEKEIILTLGDASNDLNQS